MKDAIENTVAAEEEGFTLRSWAKTTPEVFDLSAVFAAQIEPLMDELTSRCASLGIPVLMIATESQTAANGATYHIQGHRGSAARIPGGMLAAEAAASMNLSLLFSIIDAMDSRPDAPQSH